VPVFSCGISLYIDCRMVVVVGGNVLHHVKREGELSGWGEMSGGICPTEGECPGNVLLAQPVDPVE